MVVSLQTCEQLHVFIQGPCVPGNIAKQMLDDGKLSVLGFSLSFSSGAFDLGLGPDMAYVFHVVQFSSLSFSLASEDEVTVS